MYQCWEHIGVDQYIYIQGKGQNNGALFIEIPSNELLASFLLCFLPSVGVRFMSVSHTHIVKKVQLRIETCIDTLIICYVCKLHIHIIRDYKRSNLLLYVCVTHTHERR